jgi:hypothetical protein
MAMAWDRGPSLQSCLAPIAGAPNVRVLHLPYNGSEVYATLFRAKRGSRRSIALAKPTTMRHSALQIKVENQASRLKGLGRDMWKDNSAEGSMPLGRHDRSALAACMTRTHDLPLLEVDAGA